ncbi:SDR family NAD(P)-dependent oxidoreductase [Hyunsoonleella pacifica]|uniref:Glucose 1-dehydrogenase n=1 Tax=Hyunsoonleella pacifica TaxID=1080224 RepID=A0A4Q9FRD0_9FLAO|nr:glucose 1-dehydrogenase [Hyunsoonleella pacifica]TBN17396.1 glucose 1-dehydrogenase [Hyunsoonleella pacifica]GGD12302.1 oxidoreductase [Hyunsoonleella pacifica]
MKKLDDKVVLITGASKGIGAEIAKNMAKEGAKVIVNYNNDKVGAERVVLEIEKQGGKAIAINADVTNKEHIEVLFKKTKSIFGEITTLVNNAGVYKFEPIETITKDEFHNHFNTNVLSVFLLIQEAIKHFDNNGGNIINISSIATVKSTPFTSLYSASKGAIDSITNVLSQELGPKNIRINSILPGPTETEGNQMSQEIKSFVTSNTPLGKIGRTTDIAQLAVFLASNDASFITGQKIGVSGGFE